jgi:hypothetical protein
MMEALQYLFFAAGLSLFIGLPAWIVVKNARWVTRRRSISNSMTSESTRLQPESQFIVTISEQAITCKRPDGTTESVRLDDLQKVDILTTSDGPFAPDVFWLLHGSAGGCSIPQGATGEPELLDYLQTLPAFDNQAVIQAMGSTQEAIFHCWSRPAEA